MNEWRTERFSGSSGPENPTDARTDFERDSDRILYSGAFRRLAVITQVVSPAGGHAFHNRLTHALKVAQVGRRIAERLRTPGNKDLIDALGGLDPSVVEAAALAHDLGHPPFGHIAEEELHDLLKSHEEDGYEGNPQSFRIVTRLESRDTVKIEPGKVVGLDLTLATLNALLKYPKLRPRVDEHVKFGAYRTEEDVFNFARKHGPSGNRRSIEADIMDWADDITYAVHDLEDFYRIGKIPLDVLTRSPAAVRAFFQARFELIHDEKSVDDPQPHKTTGYKKAISPERLKTFHAAADDFFPNSPVSEPYTGRRAQRAALRALGSSIIHDAVSQTTLSETGLVRPVKAQATVAILKQLTWHYVIEDPALATEQFGKRRVIRELFEILGNAASERKSWKMFPVPWQEQLEDKAVSIRRTTADYIASMGEQRAVQLHAEFAGTSLKPLTTGVWL